MATNFGRVDSAPRRDDMSWLDSREGVTTATTLTARSADFEGDVLVSGTPVARDGDFAVPYVPGTNDLYGFNLYGRDVSGDNEAVAVMRNGHVYVPNLPVDFAPVDHAHFTFVS